MPEVFRIWDEYMRAMEGVPGCNLKPYLSIFKEPVMNNTEKRRLLLLDAEKFDWCAANPDKEKEDWPRYEKNGGDAPNSFFDCYVCVISKREEQIGGSFYNECVANCIIDWGGQKPGCLENDSIYKLYSESSGKIRSHYASIIAETLRLAAVGLPEDEPEGTPTPWKVIKYNDEILIVRDGVLRRKDQREVIACSPGSLSKGSDHWEKNAADIVLARNNFERMRAFVQEIIDKYKSITRFGHLKETQIMFIKGFQPIKEAKEILADLEGGSHVDNK